MEKQFVHFPVRTEVELHPKAFEIVDDPKHPVEALLEAWRGEGNVATRPEGAPPQSRTRASANTAEPPPAKTQRKTELPLHLSG